MNKRLNTIGIICIILSILIIMANMIYGDVNIAPVGFAVAAVGYILISIGKIKGADKQTIFDRRMGTGKSTRLLHGLGSEGVDDT